MFFRQSQIDRSEIIQEHECANATLPQNSITSQFDVPPKLQEFEMAIYAIHRRQFSNLEITVWNARDGYEEDLSVKIANRHRSTKPYSTFSINDFQAASLLIQDVIEMFEPLSPRSDLELD